MLASILIANRGEIARRIVRTARSLGVETIAVHSDIDEEFLFVQEADKALRIGGAKPKDSYLNINNIIAAARESGAGACLRHTRRIRREPETRARTLGRVHTPQQHHSRSVSKPRGRDVAKLDLPIA